MALKEQITADMIASMKARDELKTGTLRMMKADIMKYEVSGKDMKVTDDIVLDLLKRGIKQRRDATEGFKKGGNTAAAEKELAEIKIIEVYMPAQMSEAELKKIVADTIKQINATPAEPSASLSPSFGKVMGAVMGKVKGKADGALVSKAVKELLR